MKYHLRILKERAADGDVWALAGLANRTLQ
jgi:hypothetical protein